jgi:hypothetical protein
MPGSDARLYCKVVAQCLHQFSHEEVKSMKLPFIVLALAACLVAFTPLSAQSVDRHGYTTYGDEFDAGYQDGYDHGLRDRRAGFNFDFEHSDVYASGTVDFQSGYEEGYSDAYYGRSSDVSRTDEGIVEIFSATGFRGNVMRLGIGRYNSIELDDVESLRINGHVRVILFNEPEFQGKTIILTGDAPNLRPMQKRSFFPFGLLRHHTGSLIIEPLR